jgi:hypothetical protein
MVDGIIAATIVVALIVGFWLTRNAKGENRPPGTIAQEGLTDLTLKRLEHGEAFEDEKPRG